eukprot:7766820-Heterocapsa_arctica.AAC.1
MSPTAPMLWDRKRMSTPPGASHSRSTSSSRAPVDLERVSQALRGYAAVPEEEVVEEEVVKEEPEPGSEEETFYDVDYVNCPVYL